MVQDLGKITLADVFDTLFAGKNTVREGTREAAKVAKAVFLSDLICPMAISRILTGRKSFHFPLGPNFNWPEKT